MTVFMVLLGGAIGAPVRMWLDSLITARLGKRQLPVWSRDFLTGTYIINISGSFLLGFLTGLSLHNHVSALITAFLGIGFCGAYTTFSTWSFESVRLFEKRSYVAGVMNIIFSLGLGLLLAVFGIALGDKV